MLTCSSAATYGMLRRTRVLGSWRQERARNHAVKASVERVDCPEIGQANHNQCAPSTDQCSIEKRCSQYEMHIGACRVLRRSNGLSSSLSILRRAVTTVPCACTHASAPKAGHDSFGNVERLLEREWMLLRPDTIVRVSCFDTFLHPL